MVGERGPEIGYMVSNGLDTWLLGIRTSQSADYLREWPAVCRQPQIPPGVLMQHTREELAELLRESQENLKKSRSTHRKLKTVITKVNKVIGRRRSVKRKPPK